MLNQAKNNKYYKTKFYKYDSFQNFECNLLKIFCNLVTFHSEPSISNNDLLLQIFM